jgi:3-methyladenine DNA glycosylase AlkD
MISANQVKKEVQKLANPERAKGASRYFKTGKGQYGEGDRFIGVDTPTVRAVAKKYRDLPFTEIQKLLDSKIHEHRTIALSILVSQYQKAEEAKQKEIYDFYLQNTENINNWDLVDISANKIVGNYLLDKDKSILYRLAKSQNLWERRIAIMATFEFIRNNRFEDSLRIAEMLLGDKHDLIYKATGWMLREIGNRDQKTEEKFLKKYTLKMPRTMLRYAIEHFEEPKRKYYLLLK